MDKETFIQNLKMIAGIDHHIAQALYDSGYNSLESFEGAIPKDLIMVKGINPTQARKILKRINESVNLSYSGSRSDEETTKEKIVSADIEGLDYSIPQPAMRTAWFWKASLWGLLWIWIFGFSFIPFAFFMPGLYFMIFGVISLLAFIIAKIWSGLYYDSYHYEIKDSEIIVEHGVLFHKKTMIPYKRIQNVNVVQGPITRMVGLKSIQIETAGSNMYRLGPAGTGLSEGQIPGPEEPDVLANLIIEKVKKYKTAEGL